MSADRRSRRLRRLRLARNVLAVVVAVGAVTAAFVAPARSAPVPGSAGVDTSLPPTDSQVTVDGRGQWSGVEFTVNQTRNLVNQAISVTWEGAPPTVASPGRFGANYMQIFQCWGDPDDAVPENPGPPPEQCVQGATAGTYGGLPGGLFPSGFALSRIISRVGWGTHDPAVGFVEQETGNVWRSFRAVDGTVVDAHTNPDFNPSVEGGFYWLNTDFNVVTTNEIAGAATGPNGKGAELFQVTTGKESPGLGCGQRAQPVAGSDPTTPRCWLVIVPRGDAATENAGTPFEQDAAQVGVFTSPLSEAAWANRVAVELEFNPVDSACDINAKDRRLAGSELVVPAVSSWQPELCTNGLPPYTFGTIADTNARQQIVAGGTGAPGMAVVSRPLDEAGLDPANPTVYAPLSLSGLVIGFNVERNPRPDAPAGAQALAGVRVADLNLTPRLVAKLLTQSYTSQVRIFSDPAYPWANGNPAHLGQDPDFLRFNPEFELLQIASAKNFGGLLTVLRNSDAALQVWEWILADPEARAWLDGQPDEWGMEVNPVYSTDPALNPAGAAFGDPVPDSFPKSDPYCFQAPPTGSTGGIIPPKLCGTDWLPYTQSLRDAARLTRLADDGAKVALDPFALTADQVWKRDLPQFLGRRSILSLTDTATAAQYGLQVARLSRAGDDGVERDFVAPDAAGLTAGVAAMAPDGQQPVLVPDPLAEVADAYPLTALTYGVIRPLDLDDAARADYAAFVEYATGPGQEPGLELGRLPMGYAPLPGDLKAQAAQAATAIRTLQPVPDTPETTVGGGLAGGTGSIPRGSTGRGPAPTTAPSVVDEVAAAPVASVADAGDDEPLVLTPILALARNRYVVPILAAVALAAVMASLEITKRPRRATRASATGGGGPS